MYLDRVRELNARLVTDAVRLHQAGALRADTYLLDLDALAANARVIRAAADAAGLRLYAMTKQFGRNPDACDAIAGAGIPMAVAVDTQCMEAVLRSARMRVGHVGHLVQPQRGTEDAVIAARPEVVTVFHEDIARRLGAAAARAGVEQAVLLRVVAPGDRFYFGHGGGLPLDGIEASARRIDAIPGLHVVGVTSFPALLANQETGRIETTPNMTTLVRAAERLRAAGFAIEQVNAPGTTSSGTMRMLADAGATHAEPGNGLSGTSPLMILEPSSPEVPAIVHVTEVSHFDGHDAYVFGAGLYVDRVLGPYGLRAMVGRDDTLLERVHPAEMAPDGAISYYAVLHLPAHHDVRVGDTVVFCFRPQAFVTRGRTRALFRDLDGSPRLGDACDVVDGRRIAGVS
jgi:predicted amino acid racemase